MNVGEKHSNRKTNKVAQVSHAFQLDNIWSRFQ